MSNIKFELHALPPGFKLIVMDDGNGFTAVRFLPSDAADDPVPPAAIGASSNYSKLSNSSPDPPSPAAAPAEAADRPVAKERLNLEFFKQVILERDGVTAETVLLPTIEWHAAAVIAEAGRRGVTYSELIERVPGWNIEDVPAKEGKPGQPATTNNAVDVAVSKIGKRLREARIHYQISREEREEKTENGRILRKIYLFFERLNL